MAVVYRVEGLDEALRKLDPKMVDRPVQNFLNRASILVQNEARRRSPVDTGRLRSSIAREVSARQAMIGTNVHYAPYVELGTSRMRAQPYLEPGLTSQEGAIRALLPVLAAEIEAEAAGG